MALEDAWEKRRKSAVTIICLATERHFPVRHLRKRVDSQKISYHWRTGRQWGVH